MDRYTLHHGDCIEVMRGMADNSVDAIVTDPPYELGFMGKSWDASGIAFNVEVWSECLRILKPGGHLLAFSGSRTYHRMAVAIEDAGFEVRDQIMWLYGSGFPKSLDVSKAIDKVNGDGDRLLKFTRWMRSTGLKAKQIDTTLKAAELISPTSNFAIHYFNDGQPAIPTAAMWQVIRPMISEVPAWVDELVERIEAEREVIGSKKSSLGGTVAAGERNQEFINKHRGLEFAVTAPATPAAQQWQGWGTALKPAHEPIVLARKPLIGTVAANVLAHGTGALNIDGCRVGTEDDLARVNNGTATWGTYGSGANRAATEGTLGRWPANVIHDGSDEVVAGFPVTAAGNRPANRNVSSTFNANSQQQGAENAGRLEGGSAARFFYCAKASKRDRNEGLEGTRNGHPTVKPQALMRYLIRLITPPGAVVLDPFMGSGSTGKAAMFEGVRFIGIEQDADYLAIAQARIKWALAQPLEEVIFPRATEPTEAELEQLAFPIEQAGEASA